jgi:hypothetical protein
MHHFLVLALSLTLTNQTDPRIAKICEDQALTERECQLFSKGVEFMLASERLSEELATCKQQLSLYIPPEPKEHEPKFGGQGPTLEASIDFPIWATIGVSILSVGLGMGLGYAIHGSK